MKGCIFMAETKEKLVTINIPLVRGARNDDVFVSVNDRKWLIKRGVDVKVPECVKEVLEHEAHQYYAAAQYESSLSTASSAEEKNS
jgi:hypothetical protein